MCKIWKIWPGIVLLCLVLMGCAGFEIISEPLLTETNYKIARLAPLCEAGDPGSCYDIGDAYKKAAHFNEALVYFKQGCNMWNRFKDLAYSDMENSPLARSEACCLFSGYTSQILDDYRTMLAYDSFGCNNFKTSIRESACNGAETASSGVNADDQLNSTIANGIMGFATTAEQGMQQVDAAK
jgi:hypothetical protein